MCIVWSSHSKWLSKYGNKPASNFTVSLNIPPWKLFRWFRRPNWRLAASSQQCTCSCIMSHAEVFGEISNHPGDLASPTAQIWHPVTSSFSQNWNHLWKGRDFRPSSMRFRKIGWGSWWQLGELCEVPSAYFEGDWGVLVLGTMLLVSWIFFSKCLYFSYYVAGHLLARPCISLPCTHLSACVGFVQTYTTIESPLPLLPSPTNSVRTLLTFNSTG